MKQRGDGKALMKILRFKNLANVSGVMTGDRSTTLAKIEKIKRFIEAREKVVAAINDDDLN